MEINLINKDCIEGLQNVNTNSIDLIFCDLPYGTTAAKWDTKIDLNKLCIELLRISKEYCCIVFTCKFLFGIEIINAMGKKYFRYDMVLKK